MTKIREAPALVLRRDRTRTVLVVLLMAILIGSSFWVLRPFLLHSAGQ